MKGVPRLPLNGIIDLTYRCNNHCLHCWLWIPAGDLQQKSELTFDEIKRLADEARALGCQSWTIMGGEPMLRTDFPEIFDYLTRKAVHYDLNTNGTLITPEIAKLLQRKGNKMVALCGATAEVHDRITRSPGSFEATMRGLAYLKEANASFTVQIVPLRANHHQYQQMIELARSLSPTYRIGAPWLYLTACGDPLRNREIEQQRLDPRMVVELDTPDIYFEETPAISNGPVAENSRASACQANGGHYIFADCIASRRDFHVDPYGQMSFCCFIKDPALRYDLRQGNFREAWEVFIPSLATKVPVNQEYLDNCGRCDLRADCRWCGVYAFLEHRRYTAPVTYLCEVARENRRYKEEWKKNHRRYYQIGGITLQIDAEIPINGLTFSSQLNDSAS